VRIVVVNYGNGVSMVSGATLCAMRTGIRNRFWTQCWPFVALCLAATASAQRPNNGATCEAGTPILFNDNGAWGYVTSSGRTIPPRFTTAMPFSSGMAAVCTPDGCGLLNKSGDFVSPLRDKRTANLAIRYSEGVGVIVKDGKWGYVDLSGNLVIIPTFQYAGDFEFGLARVKLNGKYFFIDHEGRAATPRFDGLFDFNDDMAAALVGDKVGYIRRDGSFALPPEYYGTSGIDFQEGLVAVRIGGKVGFIDKAGSITVKPSYDDAYPFSEGLAMVRLGDRWGYIDKGGTMVIPARFQIAHMFNEGVASVQLAEHGKWGYIDHTGKFLIAPEFDAALPFCAGLAPVETFRRIGSPSGASRTYRFEGKHGLIDHSGKYIWRDSVDRVWDGPIHF
jgi:WG containing repeat